MRPAEKVKKFELWRAPFGGTSHCGTPILTSTHFETLIHLALMV